LCQKHLTIFEIRKPACPQNGASILTVIVRSVVWSNFPRGKDCHARSYAICFRILLQLPLTSVSDLDGP